MSIGAARARDVSDADTNPERVNIHHRPDKGTNRKNGPRGKRPVAISTEPAESIDIDVNHVRRDAADEDGREPLFSSSHGHISRKNIRRPFTISLHHTLRATRARTVKEMKVAH